VGEVDVPESGVVVVGDDGDEAEGREDGRLLVTSSSEARFEKAFWPHHSRTASESSGKTNKPPCGYSLRLKGRGQISALMIMEKNRIRTSRPARISSRRWASSRSRKWWLWVIAPPASST
jgi:hypothetical protein